MQRIRVLGPIEVFDGQQWMPLSAAKPRALLAALVAHAPGVVSSDALIEEVWGERPPKTASTQIHGYVMRLRRLLDDHDGEVLVTSPPGYRLQLKADHIDAEGADELVTTACAALRAGNADEAADAAHQALELWRGEAYSDVAPTLLLQPHMERLKELRLTAVETLIAADLARERYQSVIGEARSHLSKYALREQVWGCLMSALWRSGRQAEALEAYRTLRTILADELGVDPCQEVRDLHAQILAGEAPPRLTVEVHEPASTPSDEASGQLLRGPMAQLPPMVADFTGRDAEVEAVVQAVTTVAPDDPPAVVVVHGPPGAGKSSVAVHAARHLSDSFPDGQLYLAAAGTSSTAMEPADLVAEALVALGMSARGMPPGLTARAALFRSVLAQRRVLILVDDAGAAEQVRAVLPPDGRSAVIVSSRRLLTDIPGSIHIEVGPFGPHEAYELFARIVGRARVDAEEQNAHQITRACGMLPLSIRIAGGKLLGRPRWSLGVLLARLDDESRRLSELRLGDLDVRSSVDLSLRSLESEAQEAFSLLGLLGAYDLPGWIVGPLLDAYDAEHVLDTLVDANLLAQSTPGPDGQPRYRLHDLLRVHAVESARDIPPAMQRAAIGRVLASWLDLVEQATRRLPPNPLAPPTGPAQRRPLPAYQTRAVLAKPLDWFDSERTTLMGMVRLAHEWKFAELAWELPAALVPYFDDRALYDLWWQSHQLALEAATSDLGRAVMLRGLAQIHIYRSEFDKSAETAERALELHRKIGNQHGEAMAVGAMATYHRLAGRWELAYEDVEKALALITGAGNSTFEANLRCAAGTILVAQGRPQEAGVWFQDALQLARDGGDVHREALVLREISQMQHDLGDTSAALVGLRRAEEILSGLQDERCIAFALAKRAQIYASTGDLDAALDAWTTAARTFRANGTLADEASCYSAMAQLQRSRGDEDARRSHLRRAIELWRAVGHDDKADDADQALTQVSA